MSLSYYSAVSYSPRVLGLGLASIHRSSSDCMLCGSHVVNMWLLVMNRTGPMSQLPAAKGRELPGGGPRRRSGLFTVCRGSRLLAVMNSSPFAT